MCFFLINTVQDYNVFSPPYDFLHNIFFSLAYLIVRKQHMTHIAYKIYINRLFMLSVRLPSNSRLSVVKLWGSQKFLLGFLTVGVGGGESVPQTLHHSRVKCIVE